MLFFLIKSNKNHVLYINCFIKIDLIIKLKKKIEWLKKIQKDFFERFMKKVVNQIAYFEELSLKLLIRTCV